MWHAQDGMGWWMVFAGVIWMVFLVSVVYLFISVLARGGRESDSGGDALEIARRRLALGEITTAQFQEIRGHIQGSTP